MKIPWQFPSLSGHTYIFQHSKQIHSDTVASHTETQKPREAHTQHTRTLSRRDLHTHRERPTYGSNTSDGSHRPTHTESQADTNTQPHPSIPIDTQKHTETTHRDKQTHHRHTYWHSDRQIQRVTQTHSFHILLGKCPVHCLHLIQRMKPVKLTYQHIHNISLIH